MSEDNFPSAVLGLFGTALETAVHETKMELSNASTLSKQNKAMQCPIAGIFFGKLAVRKSVSPDRVATLWVKVKSNGVMSSQPNTNLHNSDQLSVFICQMTIKGMKLSFILRFLVEMSANLILVYTTNIFFIDIPTCMLKKRNPF